MSKTPEARQPRLVDQLSTLEELCQGHLQFGERLLRANDQGAIFHWDHLAIGVLDRSMALIRGFSTLIHDNFTCAAPLVRFQLDNLLRFAASLLVDNPDDFTLKVMRGERIDKMKDRNGNKMTDKHLVQKIEERNPGMQAIYERGSGYVHLSQVHLFAPITQADPDARTMSLAISGRDHTITDEQRSEAIETMTTVTKLLLQVGYHIQLKQMRPTPVRR